MKSRIMYIERKAGSVTGEARIGRVSFSKTGRTLYYRNMAFLKVKDGFKYNCIELETGEEYWISGCKKDGTDSLYAPKPIFIDEDCRIDYWTTIRNKPEIIYNKFSK